MAPSDPSPGTSADRPEGQPTAEATAPKIFMVVVDDSREWRTALRFACRRAASLNARILLLRVVEPDDYSNWMRVGEVIREEQREAAERLLQQVARSVNELTNAMPVLVVREGILRDEVAKLVEETPRICALILGANPGTEGPGPLIQHFAGKRASRLRVPVTIVPGWLSDEEIDGLTAV